MEFKDLTEEQKAKISSCKTPEEVQELAKGEGYELTDEELSEVSGGSWGAAVKCPSCGSENVSTFSLDPHSPYMTHECNSCGHRW